MQKCSLRWFDNKRKNEGLFAKQICKGEWLVWAEEKDQENKSFLKKRRVKTLKGKMPCMAWCVVFRESKTFKNINVWIVFDVK